MTAFNSIEAAVVTALSGAPAVSTRIQRGRSRPLPEENATGVAVRIEGGENELADIGGGQLWNTRLVMELQARTTAAQAPMAAVDTLLAAVNTKIAADPTLGGLAMDCWLVSVEYEPEDADYAVVALTTVWNVLHQTARATLT